MSVKDVHELEFDRLFDLQVNDAIRKAKADPDEAARVLLLAAKFLRQHKPLPYALADYLADAFEAAMAKPRGVRHKELGFELQLTNRNTRPHALDTVAAYTLIQQNYHLVDQTGDHVNVMTLEIKKLLMKKGGCSEKHARGLLLKIDKELRGEEDQLKDQLLKSHP